MKRPLSLSMACLVMLLGMALLFAGGCSAKKTSLLKKKQQDVLKAYRQHITESIDDPERAGKLIVLGEDLSRQLELDIETLRQMAADLHILNGGYDTTREDLETSLRAINEHRRFMREKILAARVKAVKLTTPEEWQALSNRNRTLMDLIRETPGLL